MEFWLQRIFSYPPYSVDLVCFKLSNDSITLPQCKATWKICENPCGSNRELQTVLAVNRTSTSCSVQDFLSHVILMACLPPKVLGWDLETSGSA